MRLLVLILLSVACVQITRRVVPLATLRRYEESETPLDAWVVRIMAWAALAIGILTDAGPNIPAEVAGFSFFILGQVFIAWAMRENRYYLPVIVTPPVVCTTGPYKYFRHPAYLGHALSQLGAWMLWRSPYAIPLVFAILGILALRASREYKLLAG